MRRFEGRRRPLAVALVLLVAATFVLTATIEAASTRSDIDRWTDSEALHVIEDVGEAIGAVLADLESIAAFIEHSEPTTATFGQFVDQIDGTKHALGISYTFVVPGNEIDRFIAEQSEIHGPYDIFGLDDNTNPIPIDRTGRSAYYPVEFFEAGELLTSLVAAEEPAFARGLDAGFHPDWRTESALASTTDGPVLSSFMSISIDVIQLDRVFFASVPVRDADGSTIGLVQALMLQQLLLPKDHESALEDVNWEVIPIGSRPTRIDADLASLYPLDLPGTTWSVAVAPTGETLAQLRGSPWWISGLIASTVIFLASFALWLLIDRRAAHRRSARVEQHAADKDRFLASISHELRTPLTVVSGLAHELHGHIFSPEERDELMDMLVEQTDELTGIVEDLLIAARSDIAMVAIHHSHVDIGVEAVRSMEAAGIKGTTRGVPTPAFADPQRVRQILRNLLTNAIRYGGPKIRIDFAEGAGWTEVVVADNGDGVPVHMREAIFQSYESAHEPTTEIRSVGLGLYISRTLARAMGGDLEYAYDGEWSHFRLRLPVTSEIRETRDDDATDSMATV
ncbi:MAG: HAMP domain-containing histidine kinase [bacterium]|nr:HAMP domain-containing histidine kinase [bacterium]